LKFEVLYKKTFLKELKKLPQGVRDKVENLSFDILPEIEDLKDIKRLRKAGRPREILQNEVW
jgi:mRNA-degrading endonuclease RelE of RelBE toxin-antitoxin system